MSPCFFTRCLSVSRAFQVAELKSKVHKNRELVRCIWEPVIIPICSLRSHIVLGKPFKQLLHDLFPSALKPGCPLWTSARPFFSWQPIKAKRQALIDVLTSGFLYFIRTILYFTATAQNNAACSQGLWRLGAARLYSNVTPQICTQWKASHTALNEDGDRKDPFSLSCSFHWSGFLCSHCFPTFRPLHPVLAWL